MKPRYPFCITSPLHLHLGPKWRVIFEISFGGGIAYSSGSLAGAGFSRKQLGLAKAELRLFIFKGVFI